VEVCTAKENYEGDTTAASPKVFVQYFPKPAVPFFMAWNGVIEHRGLKQMLNAVIHTHKYVNLYTLEENYYSLFAARVVYGALLPI
jgi:hypothetical protein